MNTLKIFAEDIKSPPAGGSYVGELVELLAGDTNRWQTGCW